MRKTRQLFRFLGENPGAGIVYASMRKRCEELSQRIAERTRRPTTVYHAGLSADDSPRGAGRLSCKGAAKSSVATLAFGMGIDKADVRFVVHYNLPGSLKAYYQEAGRGAATGCRRVACFCSAAAIDRFTSSSSRARIRRATVVQQVHAFFCGLDQNTIEMTQQEVKETLGLQIGAEGIGACEKLLEGAGVIERLEAGENTAAIRLNSELPTLVDLLPTQAKTKRQVLCAVERMVGPSRNEWCYFQPRTAARADRFR